MVKENKELTTEALDALKGKWGLAIGTYLVYMLIVGGIQVVPMIGSIGSIVIAGPMALGVAMFTIKFSRKEEAKLDQIFDGFKNFGNAIGAYFLMALFILLWTILFVIPGIIAAISYSQVFYIIAEDDTIGPMDALKKSKKMMDGYKWKYFCLGLRFVGWALLCMITLGIGFLWLIPYMHVSFAKFYDDIKANPIALEL